MPEEFWVPLTTGLPCWASARRVCNHVQQHGKVHVQELEGRRPCRLPGQKALPAAAAQSYRRTGLLSDRKRDLPFVTRCTFTPWLWPKEGGKAKERKMYVPKTS